jgi:hypothetical protein
MDAHHAHEIRVRPGPGINARFAKAIEREELIAAQKENAEAGVKQNQMKSKDVFVNGTYCAAGNPNPLLCSRRETDPASIVSKTS